MDLRLVSLGALLLFVSAVVTMETGSVGTRAPFLIAAIMCLGAAVGTMVIGSVRRDQTA